ncbi:MAG: DUF2058 domain-containing protein [Oleibacter sp.]|nr:DUF2058 domain-containing protein [Thalassolituus sp.]
MAKSLQEQLLAAGLADKQKLKKATKEQKKQEHLQRTGQENAFDETKERAEAKRKEKAQRDRELNRQRDDDAQQKAIVAQIKQMVDNNRIVSEQGDIRYQFVQGKTVKHIYVDQAIWDRLSRGQLAITTHTSGFAVIPVPIAEKILQRRDNHFIAMADNTAGQLEDDDPYAAYQIPDDLMW